MHHVTSHRLSARTLVRHTVLTGAWQVAAASVAVSAVLALAALGGPGVLALGVLACAVVVAWGWAGVLGLPSPRGSFAVLGVAAVLMCAGVVWSAHGLDVPWLPVAAGGSLIASFAHQLLRRDGRPRLVESVSSVCLGMTVTASGTMLVPVSRLDPWLVVAALAAGAVAAAVEVLGRWEQLRPWLVPGSMIAGGLAAVAFAPWSPVSWPVLLLVGVAAGAVGHASRAVFSVLPTLAHLRPRLVSAITSVLLVGIPTYAVAHIIT